MRRTPILAHTLDWESDGPGTFNVWCSLCKKAKSGLEVGDAEDWGAEHVCACRDCDGPAHDGDCPEEE